MLFSHPPVRLAPSLLFRALALPSLAFLSLSFAFALFRFRLPSHLSLTCFVLQESYMKAMIGGTGGSSSAVQNAKSVYGDLF